MRQSRVVFLALTISLSHAPITMHALCKKTNLSQVVSHHQPAITSARMINLTTVEVLRSDTTLLNIDFYGANIFRMFQDNSGGIIRDPQASPEAQILVNSPRRQAGQITLSDKNGTIDIATNRVRISIDKQTGLFKIINLIENKVITETTAPVEFSGKHTKLSLKEAP